MQNEYLINNDISTVTEDTLEEILSSKKEMLKINNFPDEYKQIEFFGDYCPKENNLNSFAYVYRKQMIENILTHLQNIKTW